MTAFRPSVLISDGVLNLRLGPEAGVREVDFDCVIDQTDLGDVVGIEVLDLRQQLGGGQVPIPPSDELPRWSYDAEIDAFYARVGEGRSQVQKAGSGVAHLNGEGLLTVLDVGVAL